MFAVYTVNSGVSDDTLISDIASIFNGVSKVENLSNKCDKTRSYIINTQPVNYTLYDGDYNLKTLFTGVANSLASNGSRVVISGVSNTLWYTDDLQTLVQLKDNTDTPITGTNITYSTTLTRYLGETGKESSDGITWTTSLIPYGGVSGAPIKKDFNGYFIAYNPDSTGNLNYIAASGSWNTNLQPIRMDTTFIYKHIPYTGNYYNLTKTTDFVNYSPYSDFYTYNAYTYPQFGTFLLTSGYKVQDFYKNTSVEFYSYVNYSSPYDRYLVIGNDFNNKITRNDIQGIFSTQPYGVDSVIGLTGSGSNLKDVVLFQKNYRSKTISDNNGMNIHLSLYNNTLYAIRSDSTNPSNYDNPRVHGFTLPTSDYSLILFAGPNYVGISYVIPNKTYSGSNLTYSYFNDPIIFYNYTHTLGKNAGMQSVISGSPTSGWTTNKIKTTNDVILKNVGLTIKTTNRYTKKYFDINANIAKLVEPLLFECIVGDVILSDFKLTDKIYLIDASYGMEGNEVIINNKKYAVIGASDSTTYVFAILKE